MTDAGAHGGYRTGGLWVGAGVALAVVLLGSAAALLGMLEYDERCTQGLVRGPGELRRTRHQAFPPATVCVFERGEVSSLDGWPVLAALLWAALTVLVLCLLTALVAEWFVPRPGPRWVAPMSRAEKLSRTGTTLFVTGSVFLTLYAAAGWKLLAGPSSACVRGGDWRYHPPRTLEYSLFPPQATCQFASGATSRLNPDGLVSLTDWAAVPALLAGIGFALAWRRRREERRTAHPEPGSPAAPRPVR
ncbi:hypothetical protein ACIQUL_33750 [Streptomyces sp. NPDC090303]|uniref:hypothetical protein n=1 Tax=Streptomyces sp. NPDC090303 TaxID=3365960 RepID=UPI00381E5AC2